MLLATQLVPLVSIAPPPPSTIFPAGRVGVQVQVLHGARVSSNSAASGVLFGSGTLAVDGAVPGAGAGDGDALGAQAGGGLQVERCRPGSRASWPRLGLLMQVWMAVVSRPRRCHQARTLWIPAGTFYLKTTTGLRAQGITIAAPAPGTAPSTATYRCRTTPRWPRCSSSPRAPCRTCTWTPTRPAGRWSTAAAARWTPAYQLGGQQHLEPAPRVRFWPPAPAVRSRTAG